MDLISKKITIITTGQPSTNPRLVKEANALVEAGYVVKVYYLYWADWAYQTDKELLQNVKWEYELLGGSPNKNCYIFIINKIKFKIFQFIAKRTNLFLERYRFKAYSTIINKIKKEKADHFIAHNLGALPIAAFASKHHKVTYSFDAEDFHRGQYNQPCREQEIDIILENKYIPNAKFITTASPLITEKYHHLFPAQQFITINNVFPKSEFKQEISLNTDNPLKLVWFSQTVGAKRGLEELLSAFNLIQDFSLELNLIGYYNQQTQEFFENLLTEKRHSILFLKPMSAKELNTKLHYFDIGIAFEIPLEFNRDICLTNKLFCYIQSGLAILVSNTLAQKLLIEEYPSIGTLVNLNNPIEISNQLRLWHINREKLHKTKKNSLHVAKTLNWENEQKKFLDLIKQAF